MRLAACLLLVLVPASAAKWNIAYQHDEDESSLYLRAIEFPSEQRGIAAGVLTEKGRPRPVAVITADGGKTWEQIRLKDDPIAIACFTDAVCWLSTEKGVWRSEEGGREWKKLSNTKGILKMQFLSATHGFAAGTSKSVWETTDGGKTWTLLPILADVAATPANTNFPAIAMSEGAGLIGGNSRAPRRDQSLFPDWMVPEEAAKRREWPGMMILLETRDGGKSWKSATNSVFGTLTAIQMTPEGRAAAALLEYFHTFEIPSEVLFIDFTTGRSQSIFREKTTAVSDISLGAGRSIMLGGTEANGFRSLPIPQKVQFLEATLADGSINVLWKRVDVDYRATAQRVKMARTPAGRLWAVTDTGFILRLDPESPKAP